MVLEITTKRISIAKLAELTGLQFGDSSQSIGAIGWGGRPFTMSVGIYEVPINGDDANIGLQSLRESVDFARLRDIEQILPDVVLTADISVIFDTANCSLEIRPEHMDFFGRHNVFIRVSCYPASGA